MTTVPTVPRSRFDGRAGVLFAVIWLGYLYSPLQHGWQRGDARGWLAVAALLAFAVVYILGFSSLLRRRRDQEFLALRWAAVVVMLALGVVVQWGAGQSGNATYIFVAVLAMQILPTRQGAVVVVGLCVASEVTGRVIPDWEPDVSYTIAIGAVGLAMWGVRQMVARNKDLVLAREENARLAVADERNRFARDLHDILGHSLTVISIKAELAGRLLDSDPERARAEIADLERLSRDALADVRTAVAGYRQLSLSGELASAREVLAAAGIRADLPHSTDDVPSELREVFAWTIREGVTNVVRHSGAAHCTVGLAADRVEVVDDGRGPDGSVPGNGLAGLRERVAAVGGTLVTETLSPGFALRVVV